MLICGRWRYDPSKRRLRVFISPTGCESQPARRLIVGYSSVPSVSLRFPRLLVGFSSVPSVGRKSPSVTPRLLLGYASVDPRLGRSADYLAEFHRFRVSSRRFFFGSLSVQKPLSVELFATDVKISPLVGFYCFGSFRLSSGTGA